MLVPTLLLSLALAVQVSAWGLQYQFYIDYVQSTSFGVWAQLAQDSLIPMFKEHRETPLTVLMPNNEAFETWIVAHGGNSTDPESLTTREWRARWSDAFEYFFFLRQLSTTEVAEGETVVLESVKTSPVGDWPLTTTFRREVGYGEIGMYNGTLSSAPYGSANVSIPDYAVGPHVWAQVISGWLTQPTNLSVSLAALNITSWPQVTSRLPSIASLETLRNFTLFVPPEEALRAALSLSDTALLEFLNAHLVEGERVVLSSDAQTFTSVAGGALKVSTAGVVSGSVNATVTARDVFSNGGVVQGVSAALVGLGATGASGL